VPTSVSIDKLQELFTEEDQKIFAQRGVPVAGYSYTSPASSFSETFEFVSEGWEQSKHPVTRYLHTRAQIGETFMASDGKGDMFYHPYMGPLLVLIGAGMGVTPLVSILRTARTFYGDTSKVDVILSSKKVELIPYYEEIKLSANKFSLIETQTEKRLNLEELISLVRPNTHYFVCGVWTNEIVAIFNAHGVQPEYLHFEAW
jgi:ferredoxin-NADP reductase